MAEVIEVNDIEELASYRLAANKLLADTPRASFFHSIDWLEAYWRHYGEGQRLRALVVRAAGQTIGIVPLVVRTRASRIGPVRVLTYPLDQWGCWYGPLGANQAATLALALRHIEHTPRDWDLVELPWVDHERSDRGRTLQAMKGLGWRAAAEPMQAVSHIDFSGGPGFSGRHEAYIASRSSKHRHEVRRACRRVHEAGRVEFIRHRPAPLRDGDGDPRWDLYDACEQVAAKSWQAGSTTGTTLTHASCRPFLRDAHAAAARNGAADLCLLKLDGTPVAFAYNYHRDGRLFGLRMGFDQSASLPSGLGKTLTDHLIEDSFRRGDRLFELGEGDEPYKHALRTGVATPWRLMHAPVSAWRGKAVVIRRRWRQREAAGAV